ncbi:MAG: methyltransferase domain-containing protein [Thiotrichales bacterium]|nr:methyltransferase domain-containing protein [Thiotrichales bacterium]
MARFEAYGVPPRPGRCPHCGAKPRSRALYRLVRDRIGPRLVAGDRVLEIGPSRFSADYIIGGGLFGPARCVAVDVRRRRHHRRLGAVGRFVASSAATLPFADAAFDVILCNNTLPYVREDRRALAEIARCLKRDGLAMIDTHRGPGPTRSADAHRREHPELGEDWFAENGDAWVYGQDFLDRAREAGLEPVEIELFPGAPDHFFTENGLKPRVRALFASHHPAGRRRFFGVSPPLSRYGSRCDRPPP